MVFLTEEYKDEILQAAFTVSTKNFKKAVQRNRVRRLLRESYRLQKSTLKEALAASEKSMYLFFIYTGSEMPDMKLISSKMKQLMNLLQKDVSGSNENSNQ